MPTSVRNWTGFVVVAALLLGGLWWAAQSAPPLQPEDPTAQRPVAGQAAPAFSAASTSGEQVALADFAGKGLWLTFGATWCADCRTEAQDLQSAASAARPGGVETVMVFVGEDSAAVTSYAEKLGFSFHQIADPKSALARQYQVVGIPTHFFIDATGQVSSVRVGVLSRAEMDAELARIVPVTG